jgi:hypothetical protein
MDHLLQNNYRRPENQRFAGHLLRERDAVFTFLHCLGLDATDWRAEQVLQPMVVTRKVWGGNRTPAGARTVSILQTCRQQGRSGTQVLPKVVMFTAVQDPGLGRSNTLNNYTFCSTA